MKYLFSFLDYRHFSRTILLLLTFSLTSNFALSKPENKTETEISGSWIGKLTVGKTSLRLRFNVVHEQINGYSATMDSIDQGASSIPVSKVVLSRTNIIFEIEMAGAVYEGTIDKSFSRIAGNWRQGNQTFPLILTRPQAAGVTRRPQEPRMPYPYLSEAVEFANTKDQITLAGTLTRPTTPGPHPAVVLISGSGPQDRDEAFMGHRPFLVIADHFTRQGIAVLRFDDRGIGSSSGKFFSATSADFAADVQAAVDYLRSRSEIDSQKIGLVGHSEGGLIAPIVAADNDDIDFILLMAGPGIPGIQISATQMRLIMRNAGISAASVDAGMRIYQSLNIAAKEKLLDVDQLKNIYDKSWGLLDEKIKKELVQFGGGQLSQERIKQLTSPWFRYFLAHDPQEWLARVKCPVLAVNGTRDIQMEATPNLDGIAKALRQSDNPHFQTRALPGLNHLLQRATTGLISEYAAIEETIAPSALTLMSHWILSVTQS